MKKKKYVTIKPRGKNPFELRATRMIQPCPRELGYSRRAERAWHNHGAHSATRAEVRRVLRKRPYWFKGRTGRQRGTFPLFFHPSGAVSFGCCRFSAKDVKKLKRWAYKEG